MAATSTTARASRINDYFQTGYNHVLCKVPGINDDSFPAEFQDTWDLEHVRLPCAKRAYPTEVSFWPEIVESLSEPILTSQQLSEVMLRWNKGKQNGWNINALDAFLNSRSAEEDFAHQGHGQGTHSDHFLDLAEQQLQAQLAGSGLDSDEYLSNGGSDAEWRNHSILKHQELTPESPRGHAQRGAGIAQVGAGGPLKSQFLSNQERQYFFDVILPKMQALALRLPELVKKPIPFLKQQQDSAVTLSQEQIACLLANAFFNTFPCRNAPYKRGRRKKPVYKRTNSSGVNGSQAQQQQNAEDDEDDDESGEEEDSHPKANKSNRGSSSTRGGRGGGRGGQQQTPCNRRKSLQTPRPSRRPRAQGPAALFEFFEDATERDLSVGVEKLIVRETEKSAIHDGQFEEASLFSAVKTEEQSEWAPKLPSINFISTFWTEENRTPCTTTQAGRLRCILHYFDRVTTEMPTGTVTFHRQVLKKPSYMAAGEGLQGDEFTFSKVTVDSTTPIEEAPQGALQLDFANKNIGGGALDKGAVQEEIRFMICPELIISRLFTQQLEANEAVLIKGAERYSNYIGYSKTFEWYSDHQDITPRDKLGRREIEICAMDARPFKSRVSRLEQFERHYILREINKAIVGFRVSPINASKWGLARPQDQEDQELQQMNVYRPIATGNWGCGAFGGHLQLKFVIQWIAASMCGIFSLQDQHVGDDVLYYTFGMHQLKDEIETFVKAIEAMDKAVRPKRVLDSIIHYPRRNSSGEIQGFREKSLLEYLSNAIAFVPQV